MKMLALFGCVFLAAPPTSAAVLEPAPRHAPRAGEDIPVTWKGKTYTSGELPSTLNEAQKRALFTWVPWAREHDYRADYDAQGRVVVLSSTKGSAPEKRMQVVGRTETWFDALFPPAAAATSAPAAPVGTPSAGEIPEDPEAAPAGAPKPAAAPSSNKPTKSDGSTAVMLVLRTEKDMESALEVLAEKHASLREWTKKAVKHTGFVVEEAMCGAYVENASGQEEWNPDHELVNRIAQLLVLRRFGQVPYWLAQGIAWEAEHAFDGALYCFPYREEFVGVGEHTGWPAELRNQFKDRATTPFQLADVANWKRGSFDAPSAHIAWGTAHFLAATDPAKFGSLLTELHAVHDRDSRKKTGATTWERDIDYEIPAAKQQEIFLKILGKDVFKNMTAWFRKPEADPARSDAKGASKSTPKNTTDRAPNR